MDVRFVLPAITAASNRVTVSFTEYLLGLVIKPSSAACAVAGPPRLIASESAKLARTSCGAIPRTRRSVWVRGIFIGLVSRCPVAAASNWTALRRYFSVGKTVAVVGRQAERACRAVADEEGSGHSCRPVESGRHQVRPETSRI
jgi:hypothetical protein